MKKIVILLIICILSSQNIDINNTSIKFTSEEKKRLREVFNPMQDLLLKIIISPSKAYNKYVECLSKMPLSYSSEVLVQFHIAKELSEEPETAAYSLFQNDKFKNIAKKHSLEQLLSMVIDDGRNDMLVINYCIDRTKYNLEK